MQELFHHYLATGEIAYLVKDAKGDDYVNRVLVNTLATLKDKNLTLANIGAIQQGLQKQLFNRTGEPEKVLDVVITGITYLGHMTKEEFSPETESEA